MTNKYDKNKSLYIQLSDEIGDNNYGISIVHYPYDNAECIDIESIDDDAKKRIINMLTTAIRFVEANAAKQHNK